MSKLCLTLAERSGTSLQQKVVEYCDKVDMVEIRLDYLDRVEVPHLPLKRRTGFIATCRPPREGGQFKATERERLLVLRRALEAGFDWIDLEYDVPVEDFPFSSAKVVRSRHFFDHFPNDLSSILSCLTEGGGAAYKIAIRIAGTGELVKLLSWVETLPADLPRVVLGMGELGRLSRIMAPYLVNLWTYVIEPGEQEVAPGQFSLQEALEVFRFGTWDASTSLLLLVGTRSPSPVRLRVLNQLFQHYGQACIALPCVVDYLEALEQYIEESSLPFWGIEDCDRVDQGETVDSRLECRALMFMESVAQQFERWTGITPDIELIKGYCSGE